MATTSDLSKLLDREMGKGQGPFLVRIFQDAEILPRVKRGGFRKMEHLTPEHLADVVMAVAATRPAGQRTWQAAKAGVERFAALQMHFEGEMGVRSLHEDLVFFLEQVRDKDVIGEEYKIIWILFIDDANKPEVELRFIGKADQRARNYSDPDVEPSPVREATVIEGEFLETLAVMIREVVVDDDEDATA